MNIGVEVVGNFPAVQTVLAAIGCDAICSNRILAIQSFRQRAGERFEFFQMMAGEKIGVAETSTSERPLQELDALRLFGKIGEGHALLF